MAFRQAFVFLLLCVLYPRAFACEGPCIKGVTTALIGNYSQIVDELCSDLATQISEEAMAHSDKKAAMYMMEPVLNTFKSQAYDSMEKAIFPGFFHGKCQINGADPKGCPNPYCPVICGTPGSIIYHYNAFVNIAYNTTRSSLLNTTSPAVSSSLFHTIEQQVKDTYGHQHHRRRLSVRPYYRRRLAKNEQSVHRILEAIFSEVNINNVLQRLCGGSSYTTCNWTAKGMQAFILSWP